MKSTGAPNRKCDHGAGRIGALIPVRSASERLPGKALLHIEGRPVLAHLLDRVFATQEVDPELVVVCTTTEKTDDELATLAGSLGARVFRGSTDDLVDRLCSAVDAFHLEIALQVDGDDPCADSGYMDMVVRCLRDYPDVDVAVIEGLPLGVASKAMRARAFAAVRESYRTRTNDTGFAYYFTRSELCEVRTLIADPQDRDPAARLTLDYEEDLAFFRELFAALHVPGTVFGVREVVQYLRAHPELRAVNSGLSEAYWRRTSERLHLEYDVPGSDARRVIEC